MVVALDASASASYSAGPATLTAVDSLAIGWVSCLAY